MLVSALIGLAFCVLHEQQRSPLCLTEYTFHTQPPFHSGPELANLLWALATVGHLDPGLVAAVRGALCGRLGELGPQQLANALWAHVRLGQYDAQVASTAAECVWEVLPQCTPRQLVAVTQVGSRPLDTFCR